MDQRPACPDLSWLPRDCGSARARAAPAPGPPGRCLGGRGAAPGPAALLASALLLALLLSPPPVSAQAFFGKNKVQYAEFSWQVMQTPHIDLHFYPEEEEVAEWVAEVAEEAWAEFTIEMGLDSLTTKRIPFLLYSTHRDFEQTNVSPGPIPEEVGGLTDLLKGRVLVPHTGSYHRLRWVVRHELVHALMLEKLSQDLRVHKKTRYTYPPLWYVEGLAEFLAADWDARADMIVRDAVIHDRLVPVDQLWTINGSFQMYKEGQSILLHIAEHHGRDKVLEFLKLWWQTDDFDRLMIEILGMTTKELDRAWTDELRRRYYPQVKERDAVDVAAERMIGHGRFNLAACALPPAGAAAADSALDLVFLSSLGGFPGLRHGVYRPGVPPDKAEPPVLLVKGGTSEDFESLHFFESALDVNARREVVFVARSGARDVLHIVDVDRRLRLASLTFPSLVALSSPSWSPDGSRIVMSGVDVSGRCDLYTVGRDGSGLRALTSDVYDDRDPDWSPDGRMIVFASDRCPGGAAGAMNLYLLDPEVSAEPVPLTSGFQEDAEPAFSPDGRLIAFRSDRHASTYDLYLVDLAGRVTPLQRFQTAALDPEWTPDGRQILFTTFLEQSFAIYRTPAIELPLPAPVEETGPILAGLTGHGSGIASTGRTLELAGLFAAGSAESDAASPGPEPTPSWDPTADLGAPADTPGGPGESAGSAWEPAVPDSSYPVSGYRRRFELDLIQGGVAYDPDFGGGGGGQIAFSDLLNNEQLLFFIANDGGSSGNFLDSFDLGFTYYNAWRRLNWGAGAFRLARTYNADLDLFLRESRVGGLFLASYPLSRFNRIETTLVVRRISNHLYRSGVVSDTYFVSNVFSYVHDGTLWSMLGPFDGSRYNLTLGLTTDIGAGIGDYVSVLGDYRWYHRLFEDMVYAMRTQARVSFGDEGQRYFVGGAFSLRGYPHRSVAGRRLLLLNQEVRFPIIDRMVVAMPAGPLDMPVFYGAGFVDMAWVGDPDWAARPVGSVGVGFFIGGGPYPRLRVDFSWPTDFHSISGRADTEFSIGFGY